MSRCSTSGTDGSITTSKEIVIKTGHTTDWRFTMNSTLSHRPGCRTIPPSRSAAQQQQDRQGSLPPHRLDLDENSLLATPLAGSSAFAALPTLSVHGPQGNGNAQGSGIRSTCMEDLAVDRLSESSLSDDDSSVSGPDAKIVQIERPGRTRSTQNSSTPSLEFAVSLVEIRTCTRPHRLYCSPKCQYTIVLIVLSKKAATLA